MRSSTVLKSGMRGAALVAVAVAVVLGSMTPAALAAGEDSPAPEQQSTQASEPTSTVGSEDASVSGENEDVVATEEETPLPEPVDEQAQEPVEEEAPETSEPEPGSVAENPPAKEPADPAATEKSENALAVDCQAWPVGTPAGFEIDGNLCLNPDTSTGTDWANTGSLLDDQYDDSTGFSGGAKEENWPWPAGDTTSTGISPATNDIGPVHVYSAVAASSVYAILGFERARSTGSISYHVEMNAKPNLYGPVPDRSPGDLRLTLEQTGNETIALVDAATWDATDGWQSLGSLAGFTGQVNQGATDNLDDDELVRGTFAEVAINLTALFGETGCSGEYGTLNLRSSTSPSETSSLKDWVEPISFQVPSTCASVIVDKEWKINGTTYDDGEQPFGTADLQLTGQSSAEFGTSYTTRSNGAEYEVGDQVTIGETVRGLPDGCRNTASGDLGTKTLEAGVNAFTVTNTVTCKVGLMVTKTWVVNGEQYPDGQQPIGTAHLTIDGEDAVFGTVYDRQHVGDSVTIAERVTGLPERCTVTATIDGRTGTSASHTITLRPDPNVVAVVNTVTCAQTLTLVKEVAFGNADPEEWTLTATATDDGFSGPSGSDEVTARPVIAGAGYVLSESDGPVVYVPSDGWTCVDDDTQSAVPLDDGAVAVTYGQAVTCTVTNTTAALTLLKHIGEDGDGVLDPADWTLSATPDCDVASLSVFETTGSETQTAGNTAEVRPDCAYTLTEELDDGSPIAYRQVALQRWDPQSSEWVDVDDATIVVAPGEHDTYRFVNDVVPAAQLPLTGGAGVLPFTIAGVVALFIAAGLMLRLARRRGYLSS